MKSDADKAYTVHFEVGQNELEPTLTPVHLHRDDFTPIEFVIGILEKFFFMDRVKATEVMMEARTQGKALCGWFARDFAEAKVAQVVDYAREHEHPLICSTDTAV